MDIATPVLCMYSLGIKAEVTLLVLLSGPSEVKKYLYPCSHPGGAAPGYPAAPIPRDKGFGTQLPSVPSYLHLHTTVYRYRRFSHRLVVLLLRFQQQQGAPVLWPP